MNADRDGHHQEHQTSSAESYEQANVHNVYSQIASHFSETRHKPWPVVDNFLRSLPQGSVGLDVGCGNGKNLTVRRDIYIIGSDRSRELAEIASKHDAPHSTVVADCLRIPHPRGCFDFAISIAVVHHLSTRERRVQAVRALLECLRETRRDNGMAAGETSEMTGAGRPAILMPARALFFVWALEQKGSRRGWDAGDEQDVLVPWVLKTKDETKHNMKKIGGSPRRAGPPSGSEHVGTSPASSKSKTVLPGNETLAPEQSRLERSGIDAKSPVTGDQHVDNTPHTYHRYYHLYAQGELEEDIVQAGGKVLEQGYDRDNWWVIACRVSNT